MTVMSDRLYVALVLGCALLGGAVGGSFATSIVNTPAEADTVPSVDRLMICYHNGHVMLRAVSGMGSDEWTEVSSGATVLSVTGSCVVYEDSR